MLPYLLDLSMAAGSRDSLSEYCREVILSQRVHTVALHNGFHSLAGQCLEDMLHTTKCMKGHHIVKGQT